MELLYSSQIPSNYIQGNKFIEWILENKCPCRVSSLNLLAFTAHTDLRNVSSKFSVRHVYVIDLNLPHLPYLVKSHDELVTTLEWNADGTRLLIGDSNGTVEIWTMKEHLIDQWTLLHRNVCFSGEYVLAALWFYAANNKLQINYEKRDLFCSYAEKFTTQPFSPSVKQFGGRPASGCICISNSGLIWAGCFVNEEEEETLITACDSLGRTRTKIDVIDLAYAKNGEFFVAASNGSVEFPIQCYRISLRLNGFEKAERNSLNIQCAYYCSFYLNCLTASLNEQQRTQHRSVTHIRFVSRDETDALVISCAGPSGSTLELWELKEKQVPIHKMFNNEPGQSSNGCSTIDWQHSTSCNYSHQVLALSTSNQAILDRNCSRQNSLLAVAYSDGVIRCLTKENLLQFCSYEFVNMKNVSSRFRNQVADMEFTWSQSVLLVLDNASQLFAFRLQPVCADGAVHTLNHTLALLEYSLVSGHDWVDIIFALRHNMIDQLCESLNESFQKQSLPVQQKWLLRQLAIKGSLYRCISANKSGDCHAQVVLYSIANLLRQLPRSRDHHDREGPAEQLSVIIQNKANEYQINKIFIQLEHKEFCVEASVLQSLQHLNQWVGDLALFLVASLPQQCHNNVRFPGGGLIFDKKALNTLRELLTIFRCWSLLCESCLPSFTRMNDQMDVIALLFKILTKCLSNELPEEQMLDECYTLHNVVLIPQMDLSLRAIGVASPSLFSQPLPLNFNYHRDAPQLRYHVKTATLDGAIRCNLSKRMDVIRYISLGSLHDLESNNLRSCSRCDSVSLIQPPVKSTATRAWDQRWSKNCVCGGYWRSCNGIN